MKPFRSARVGILGLYVGLLLSFSFAAAQTAPPAAPVSYGSSEQLNQLLARLDQASQSAQLDLAKLRVEKWKADSGTKRQTQESVDSITRNLRDALPGITGDLRKSPESLASTFKLYRNLEALYDVFRSVTESTGAFGSKDDFQSLQNDLDGLEAVRRGFADRIEGLAVTKQSELDGLRAQAQKAQAAVASEPPKKTVVDDTAPPKKVVKKKSVPKPPPASGSGDPASGSNPSPAQTH